MSLFKREGVRYKVACDVLDALITQYAEAIGIERKRRQPDETAIESAKQTQSALHLLRHHLEPSDAKAIERVIAEYGPQVRDLHQP